MIGSAQAEEGVLCNAVILHQSAGNIAGIVYSQWEGARNVGDIELGKDTSRQEVAVGSAISSIRVVATDDAGVIDPAALG